MKRLIERASAAAVATPPERDRAVDFLRVLAMAVVVLGHWLMAYLWIGPDGFTHGNALDDAVSLQLLTWGLQVMPLFFLAGGFSNGRSLGSASSAGAWLAGRARRLLVPIVPLVAFWAAITWTVGPALDPALLRAGTFVALVPLWFLSVYLGIVLLAPLSHGAWQRWGWRSVGVLAGAAVAVDLLRFVAGVEWVGWLNFIFVWGAVHQAGYGWSDWARPAIGRWLAPIGFMTMASLVILGPYPISMIGLDDQAVTNTVPPTVALLALAVMQAGLVGLAIPRLRRWLDRRTVWTGVVLGGGMAMSWYAWHLTVMALYTGLELLVGGVVLRAEPLSALWWASRPVWLVLLTALTFPLVALVAPLEGRRRGARPGWLAGVGLAGGVMSIAVLVVVGVSVPAVVAFGLSAWAAGAVTRPGAGTSVRPRAGS